MANLPIYEPAIFSENVRALEETDLANPETWNPQYETLLNNDVFLKQAIENMTELLTATITTNWSGIQAPYTQEIVVEGIKETDNPIVDIVLDEDISTALLQEKNWGNVSKIKTEDNKIIVYCNKKKTTIELPIQMKIVR